MLDSRTPAHPSRSSSELLTCRPRFPHLIADVVFDRAYKMLTKRGVSEEEAQSLDLMFVNTWKPFALPLS